MPAPRCAFASVTLNGEHLGTYVHVEAVKKPMLAQQLGEDEGDLYEGTGSDFLPHLLQNFEKETNEDEPPSPELEAMRVALEKPDGELLAALEPLIDLNAFVRYWALESLLAHADSYTGNQNNYFLYVSHKTRKLTFLPWGTDASFSPPLENPNAPPPTVNLKGALPRRLYALESTRQLYRDTLRTLLDDVWDEDALVAELERMQDLVATAGHTVAVEPSAELHEKAGEALEKIIRSRRAVMERELTGEPSPLPPAEAAFHHCDASRVTPVSGEFRAVWGSVANMGVALENSLDVQAFGKALPPGLLMSSAGVTESRPTIMYTNISLDVIHSLLLFLGPEPLAPGERSFHGFETFGILVSGPLVAPTADNAGQFTPYGWISDGTITLDEAEDQEGAVIRGRFTGNLVRTQEEP
jgi:hypothetical protein